ncbi:hypothetical protein VTH82DRAFT_3952 [Thermothelomyces myriococcoides]
MDPAEVAAALAHYRVNVLSGDRSQVVRIVYYVASLPADERQHICLTKIIYTSEPLTPSQRACIGRVLGPGVVIGSMLGNSEAGLSARSAHPSRQQQTKQHRHRHQDRVSSSISSSTGRRRRIPAPAAAVPEAERGYLCVLRLRGRDRRFSFKCAGSYFEFDRLTAFLRDPKWVVLQWQVVLTTAGETSPELALGIRLLLHSSSTSPSSSSAAASHHHQQGAPKNRAGPRPRDLLRRPK